MNILKVIQDNAVLFWLHREMRENSVLHSELNNLPGIKRKKEEKQGEEGRKCASGLKGKN
eukprot:1139466-Pelagomonas_calceolata.AAC.2